MKRTLLTAAVFSVLLSCSPDKKAEKEVADVKNAFILKKQDISKTLDIPAEVLPYEHAEIHAKVDGYVRDVKVDIGERVKKGQVLVVLDAPEVIAQYAEASALHNQAQVRFQNSRDKYSRVQNAARQEGVVAEAELISVQNQMLADSAALASARSATQAWKQMGDYLTIRAPFDGMVTQRSIYTGDFVGNASKNPLLTIERHDKFRIRVNVPESYVNSIPAEETLAFTTEAVKNKTFSAKLTRKSGRIDPDTRTELWEYEYNNQGNELKAGMYAMASLQLNRPEGSFLIPFPAVTTTLEKKFVIRVTQGKAQWVDVREGISQENGIEIFGELSEGDTLLFRATDEIKSGASVTISIQHL